MQASASAKATNVRQKRTGESDPKASMAPPAAAPTAIMMVVNVRALTNRDANSQMSGPVAVTSAATAK